MRAARRIVGGRWMGALRGSVGGGLLLALLLVHDASAELRPILKTHGAIINPDGSISDGDDVGRSETAGTMPAANGSNDLHAAHVAHEAHEAHEAALVARPPPGGHHWVPLTPAHPFTSAPMMPLGPPAHDINSCDDCCEPFDLASRHMVSAEANTQIKVPRGQMIKVGCAHGYTWSSHNVLGIVVCLSDAVAAETPLVCVEAASLAPSDVVKDDPHNSGSASTACAGCDSVMVHILGFFALVALAATVGQRNSNKRKAEMDPMPRATTRSASSGHRSDVAIELMESGCQTANFPSDPSVKQDSTTTVDMPLPMWEPSAEQTDCFPSSAAATLAALSGGQPHSPLTDIGGGDYTWEEIDQLPPAEMGGVELVPPWALQMPSDLQQPTAGQVFDYDSDQGTTSEASGGFDDDEVDFLRTAPQKYSEDELTGGGFDSGDLMGGSSIASAFMAPSHMAPAATRTEARPPPTNIRPDAPPQVSQAVAPASDRTSTTSARSQAASASAAAQRIKRERPSSSKSPARRRRGAASGAGAEKGTRSSSGGPALPQQFPAECIIPGCTYQAVSRAHMTRHLRSHSGERPFACDHPGCDYKASQREHLVSQL